MPMDGFHRRRRRGRPREATAVGRLDRKGAIDTFDADGYCALLERIRNAPPHIVYAPAFDRDIEQPIAGSIPVPPETRLVVTEGNYLLDDDSPWPSVRNLLSEVWFIDVPREERHRRLVARHVEFGKSPAAGRGVGRDIDEANADRDREVPPRRPIWW